MQRSEIDQLVRRARRDLDQLAALSATTRGVTRVAYTAEDRAAHRWFRERCEEIGLRFHTDPVGNCFGWPAGAVGRRLVLAGSHLDSVIEAGRYDGTVGVVLALAAAGHFARTGQAVPLVVANLACEESTRFGFGTLGSKFLVGDLDEASFGSFADRDGTDLATVLSGFFDGREDEVVAERLDLRATFSAFVEVHIDQGTLLTRLGAVAVVTDIVGVHRTRQRWVGRASHSGSTLRPDRRDALVAAAEFVVRANQLWREADPTGERFAFTVGQLDVRPNSPNTVPGEVELIFDLRSVDRSVMEGTRERLWGLARETGEAHGVAVRQEEVGTSKPLPMAPPLIAAFQESARRVGVPLCPCVSLAGHDALVIGRVIPAGMLLLANPTGISHSPDESASDEALGEAIAVMLDALPRIAAGLGDAS